MDHPTDSTTKLCQGGKGQYVGREGIPIDNSSGKECEPLIVFESLDLSVSNEWMCVDALVFLVYIWSDVYFAGI